jgi:GntR family transcriptional regulator, transcriptional repressor for pyruvate dehydrogenase complex
VPDPTAARSRPTRRTGKVGQSVAKDILASITEGGLGPGSQLPTEAQMMDQYGVGRGTLREALRILEVNGLIHIKPGPGGGPIVQDATTHDFGRMATLFFNARGLTMGELIEARLVMEPVTARMAAERQDPDGIAALREIVFDQGADDRTYRAVSRDFHTLVMEMSGNGVISIFAQALLEVFQERVSGSFFPAGKKRRQVVATHEAIAQAIIDGDGDTAQRLMFEHMEEYAVYARKAHPSVDTEVVDWLA